MKLIRSVVVSRYLFSFHDFSLILSISVLVLNRSELFFSSKISLKVTDAGFDPGSLIVVWYSLATSTKSHQNILLQNLQFLPRENCKPTHTNVAWKNCKPASKIDTQLLIFIIISTFFFFVLPDVRLRWVLTFTQHF